jgi:predicted peroxiredoxin
VLFVLAGIAALLGGCGPMHKAQTETSMASVHEVGKPILLLNVVSDPREDPHAVTMALQLAGHALDDGRHVVLFFNVKGVNAATRSLDPELAHRAEPIGQMLADLVERGVEVQVCPHCMKAEGIRADQLIDGATKTDRATLFSRIGPNTVVFTY